MALVGLFPLAGFWSKDEIMADAWADRQWVFWIALAGVFMTALYVGRMLIMTFAGEYRGGEPASHGADPPDEHHGPSAPHESPPVMLLPLVVLAVLAAVAGFANIDDDFTTLIDGWLPRETEELVTHGDFKMWIALASTGAGLGGLLTAWLIYKVQVIKPERIAAFLQPLPEILENKYYLDALYENVIVKSGLLGSIALVVSLWDKYVIDGVVNGIGRLTRWSSEQMRVVQAGQVQLYATVAVLGVAGAIAGILVVNS
jgi:NADH-quinone oxidoreductase subunit L